MRARCRDPQDHLSLPRVDIHEKKKSLIATGPDSKLLPVRGSVQYPRQSLLVSDAFRLSEFAVDLALQSQPLATHDLIFETPGSLFFHNSPCRKVDP